MCVSKVCVCPLFTLRCCLVQCWCMWSTLRAFILDRSRIDNSQAQNNGLWLEKRSVSLSLSSKTPRVDQSYCVKEEWLIPPCCSLSLFLSASGLHECVDCHHISLCQNLQFWLFRPFIPILDPLWLFFRLTVQMKSHITFRNLKLITGGAYAVQLPCFYISHALILIVNLCTGMSDRCFGLCF